jgi:guanylate kinase
MKTEKSAIPHIFIITGPSGVGKDTVMRALEKFNLPLQRVTTTASRPMRPGESEGNPYHFVTNDEFEHMVRQNKFAEHAWVFNSWKGITRDELEKVQNGNKGILLQLEYQGARTILAEYPHSTVIVITPPSVEVLNQRLISRGDKQAEELTKRLEQNKHWEETFAGFEYYVLSEQDKEDVAAGQVAAIIQRHLDQNDA